MIGRAEYLPGRWVNLGRDLRWSGDLDAGTLRMLNADFGPDCNETIDPMMGFGQLRRAAEVLGVRVDYLATPPKLPPGAIP